MPGRSLLSILALLAPLAACNLNPPVEDGAAMAQAQDCGTSSLSFGRCVTGEADGVKHPRHKALLRKGDKVRVTLTRAEGSTLNPGLAIKSPKESVALRHESISRTIVDETVTSVAKTWTIPTTGFYSFVAFAWSDQGQGSYTMTLECVGGPCLQAPALDTDVAGACIGEARDQVLKAMAPGQAGQQSPVAANDVGPRFRASFTDVDMPPVCAGACGHAGMSAMCTETESRLRPFAARSAECIEQVADCLSDCVPFNTSPTAVTDAASHAEAQCWSSTTRAGCSEFGAGLQACGDPQGYAVDTPAWCAAACKARHGVSPVAQNAADQQVATECDDSCRYTDPRTYRLQQSACPGETMRRGGYKSDGSPLMVCPDPDWEWTDEQQAAN